METPIEDMQAKMDSVVSITPDLGLESKTLPTSRMCQQNTTSQPLCVLGKCLIKSAFFFNHALLSATGSADDTSIT